MTLTDGIISEIATSADRKYAFNFKRCKQSTQGL